MISHVQLGQILSLSFMESLPTSGQCLAHCRSLWLRRRALLPAQRRNVDGRHSDMALLQQMISNQQDLSFLVIENSSPTQIKDVLFDMIGFLRGRGLPVLWALRSPGLQNSAITSLDVIRMLLYQALEINSSSLSSSHPITVAQLREASSHQDWLLLLKRALQGLPAAVYIIIDSDVVEYVTNRDKAVATKFLMEFVKVLGPDKARFIVSSHVFEAQQAEQDLGGEAVAALRTERPRKNANAAVRRRLRASKRKRK